MKITKRDLKRIIKEEYELVFGKQKRTTRAKRKGVARRKKVQSLNEFTKRAYRLLREAGQSKTVAKRNALKLRAQKLRK